MSEPAPTPKWESEETRARNLLLSKEANEIRTLIESNASAFDAEARERFEAELFNWTVRAIRLRGQSDRNAKNAKRASSQSDDHSPPASSDRRGTSQTPTEADHKKNLMAIKATAAKTRASIAKLNRDFAKMDKDSFRFLSRRLPFPITRRPGNVADEARPATGGMEAAAREIERQGSLERSWSHELLAMHASISHLLQGLTDSIRETDPKHGPKRRELHRDAVRGLWLVWHHATGQRAARTADRNSPFYEFVPSALKMVWPKPPASTGLIDDVCTQMRKESR